MITQINMVLCDFDEDVCGAVVPVAERGFVVQKGAPVVVEARLDVSESVQKAAGYERYAVAGAVFVFSVVQAAEERVGCEGVLVLEPVC